jgi:phosphorylase kinase alpha/beta subunit
LPYTSLLFQGMTPDQEEQCMGARGICQHLYDSAPSGRHGSMTFLCRALANILNLPVSNGELECCIS